MRYELIMKPAAEKSLDRIPKPVRKRILDALEAPRDNPRPVGCVKLAGEDRMWRSASATIACSTKSTTPAC
jgi:mRNA interferase RelE/StbE